MTEIWDGIGTTYNSPSDVCIDTAIYQANTRTNGLDAVGSAAIERALVLMD